MKQGARTPPMSAWLTKPVIPVLWPKGSEEDSLADASLIFLRGGELAELPRTLEWFKGGRPGRIPVVLHIDLLAGPIARVFGKTGINIVNRLMGLILAAVAVGLAADGLKALFPGLR